MDESPKLHYVTILVSMGCFFGFIWGIILAWNADPLYKSFIIAGSSFVCGVLGWWMSGWFLKKRTEWNRLEYGIYGEDEGTETSGDSSEKVVLSLTIVDDNGRRSSKEIHGLTKDEWHRLGAGIVKREYQYTSRILQSIFTPSSRGATIYEIITPLLKDEYVGVLVPSGSNGVAVSDDRGERFFEQLAKGDYRILRILDKPQSPTPDLDTV